MSLVLYPDSDEEDDSNDRSLNVQPSSSNSALKRRRSSELPPLPAAFHDLYSSNARISTSDDPSLHGGRKRAVPHTEGNWPSHVYLEWLPSQAESQNLYSLIDEIKGKIEDDIKSKGKFLAGPDITPSLLSPLGVPLPLHISLSRTLQIKTEDREVFLDTLIAFLQKAAVKPFSVRPSRLKWVPNFERNRWFLVIFAEKPAQNELNRLLGACNDAAQKCGHPGLYSGGKGDGPMERETSAANPRKRRKSSQVEKPAEEVDYTENFHVSIAWGLVEPDPAWIRLVQDLDISKHVDEIEMSFHVVKAKIGNVVNNIDLGSKKSGLMAKGGLLGLG